MKALVTGASGFIGSTLIDLLGQEGFEVHAMMRKTSKDSNLRGLRYQRVEGDLSDPVSLERAVQGMDLVFHLAGAVIAGTKDEFFEHNAHGTARLAEAAARSGSVKRFVYVSSLAAGGPADSREGRHEGMADRPVSTYGESKRAGETSLLRFKEKMDVVIIRPPIVYGPKDWNVFILIRAVSKRLLPKFSSRAPSGEKYYSVIHSEDLVRGILQAGRVPADRFQSGEVFYISSGECITQTELIDEMARNLGVRAIRFPLPTFLLYPIAALLTFLGALRKKPFSLNLDKLNEIDADYWVCSHEKVCSKLDFKPRYPLGEGMRQTIQWYRENGWLK